MEATDEGNKLVPVLHAQQAFQHCVPGDEVVCVNAINGDDGGLGSRSVMDCITCATHSHPVFFG